LPAFDDRDRAILADLVRRDRRTPASDLPRSAGLRAHVVARRRFTWSHAAPAAPRSVSRPWLSKARTGVERRAAAAGAREIGGHIFSAPAEKPRAHRPSSARWVAEEADPLRRPVNSALASLVRGNIAPDARRVWSHECVNLTDDDVSARTPARPRAPFAVRAGRAISGVVMRIVRPASALKACAFGLLADVHRCESKSSAETLRCAAHAPSAIRPSRNRRPPDCVRPSTANL